MLLEPQPVERSSCLVVRGTKLSLQSRGNRGVFLSAFRELSAASAPRHQRLQQRACPGVPALLSPTVGTAQDSHPQHHPRAEPSAAAMGSFQLRDVFYHLSALLLQIPPTRFPLPAALSPLQQGTPIPSIVLCSEKLEKNQYFRGFAKRESCSRVIRTIKSHGFQYNSFATPAEHHEVWQCG